MDQIKIGKFIAQLRHREGLTQEALGEKLGVTNKTISRWETGSYMPGIEMLQLLSQVFDISINELLAGQRLEDGDFKQQADENIVQVVKESAFTFKEQRGFWERRWWKANLLRLLLWAVLFLAYFIYGCVTEDTLLMALSPWVITGIFAHLRNQRTIYVENKLFGPAKK